MIPALNPVRFGSFELDLHSGELHKEGLKVRLADQPLQVLILLLEHPGEVVSREELQRRLWSSDTFVEFEHSLNAAVKRLREALGDSAENPRFIETLPRHGYRFIAPIAPRVITTGAGIVPYTRGPTATRSWLRWGITAVSVVVVVIAFPLSRWIWRQWHPHNGPIIPIHSLAVLPLVNLSNDPNQEYFSDGMTEALITELGQVRSLRVISRQSAMQFKNSAKTVARIGEELKVDALVEGSAFRDGDKVRISIQLIRVKPEEHVWAHSYERNFRDIIALQREVARAIVSEIQGTLQTRDTQLSRARTLEFSARSVDPESYELYLKGRYYWDKRTPDGITKSLEYFKSSAEKDPTNALAYAGLADSYIVSGSGQHGLMSPRQAMPKAEAAAKHALTLDSALAEAHTTLGYVKFYFDWNPAGSEREFQQALELNPSYATARHWYALSLNAQGRFIDAIREIRKAESLDPLSLIISADAGTILHYARQEDQAIAQLRKTLEMEPNFATAHFVLARCYAQQKRYPEAIAAMKRAIELAGDQPFWTACLGYFFAIADQRSEATELLNKLNEQSKRRFIPAGGLAWAYIGLGDTDRAFYWLEKAYAAHEDTVVVLKVQPELDPLRSDPRFQDLLRRVNLSQ